MKTLWPSQRFKNKNLRLNTELTHFKILCNTVARSQCKETFFLITSHIWVLFLVFATGSHEALLGVVVEGSLVDRIITRALKTETKKKRGPKFVQPVSLPCKAHVSKE
jgi:hypothetical protein